MVPAATSERRCERRDLARQVGAGVDGAVELPPGQHRQVAVAIGDQPLGLREELRSGPSAVEQRHLVTAASAAETKCRPTNAVPPTTRICMTGTVDGRSGGCPVAIDRAGS